MRGVAHFGCVALALGLITIGDAAGAGRNHSDQAVDVRALPNGKYLYKGKEITARDLIRLGEHEEINLVVSKDQLANDPLIKQIQEDAKRHGGVTHIGFIGIQSKQVDPPVKTSNTVVIQADASILWNGAKIDSDAFNRLCKEASQHKPRPEIHIKPDRLAKYDAVAKILTDIQKDGCTNIGFTGVDTGR